MLDKVETGDLFPETTAARRRTLVQLARVVAYTAIAGVVLVTAVHAVLLVLFSTETAAPVGGLVGLILDGVRIAFPILAEVGAVAVMLGWFGHVWRGPQRAWAASVELVWLGFAGTNLVTVFAVERGAELAGWQLAWVAWGFPVSSLVIGCLVYLTLKAAPEYQREAEKEAQREKLAMLQFRAAADVLQSPQYRQVLAQRGWLQVVEALRADGYTADQVRFMLSGVPELVEAAGRQQETAGNGNQTHQDGAHGPQAAGAVPVVPFVANGHRGTP